MTAELKLDLDPRGNVKADTQSYHTSLPRCSPAGVRMAADENARPPDVS